MVFRDLKNALAVVLFGVVFTGASWGAGGDTSLSNAVEHAVSDSVESKSSADVYKQMELFTEVMLLVRKYHVEEHTYDELVYGAINGMLRSLDAHSAFMDADEYQALQNETHGAYAGIGAKIGLRGGVLIVIAPIEGSPAFRAGLQSGDKVLAIDGESTVGITVGEAVKTLRGSKGEKVVLTILSEDAKEPREVEIVRDEIALSSIKGVKMLRGGVGYIRITQFTRPTTELLHKALAKLKGEGMKALVLDLRGNPGGLLDQAVGVAGSFLKKGQVIVSTRGRAGITKSTDLKAEDASPYTKMPLVVLINGGSASASEIVAGALQDHGRAVLIGETSYGKGSVQSVIPCRADHGKSAIRLTTAFYYTPKGRLIHGIGLEPDIAVEMGRQAWRAVQIKRLQEESPKVYSDADKAKYADARDLQLERALDLLTAINIFGRRW